jgi:hypothetical protein
LSQFFSPRLRRTSLETFLFFRARTARVVESQIFRRALTPKFFRRACGNYFFLARRRCASLEAKFFRRTSGARL